MIQETHAFTGTDENLQEKYLRHHIASLTAKTITILAKRHEESIHEWTKIVLGTYTYKNICNVETGLCGEGPVYIASCVEEELREAKAGNLIDAKTYLEQLRGQFKGGA